MWSYKSNCLLLLLNKSDLFTATMIQMMYDKEIWIKQLLRIKLWKKDY